MWKPVNNSSRVQPETGAYTDWKVEIADACESQCVYCAISVASMGGLDNFHVEHFRPKSKFEDLINTITNLYLACAICNRFKSNDWPNDPVDDHSAPAYPDPGACDYSTLFAIDDNSFTVSGLCVAARYTTERLYLNRPQLTTERWLVSLSERFRAVRAEFDELTTRLMVHPDAIQARELLGAICKVLVSISAAYQNAIESNPYALEEVRRRPKTTK